MAAQYRLVAPAFVNNVYYEAGAIVTEGVELPLGFKPSLAFDPTNTDGINAMFAQGPRELTTANAPWSQGLWGIQAGRFVGQNVMPPANVWKQVGPNQWLLGSLGPRNP